MVAKENNVKYIIDDGLLVSENNVVAGTSAKKLQQSRNCKKAIFINEKTEMK